MLMMVITDDGDVDVVDDDTNITYICRSTAVCPHRPSRHCGCEDTVGDLHFRKTPPFDPTRERAQLFADSILLNMWSQML